MSSHPNDRRTAAGTPPAADWLRLDDDRSTADRITAIRPAGLTAAALDDWPEVPGYEVLGVLGRGGMGVVYQARHRDLDRVVALKMLLSNDAAGLARFKTEAESIARLQHPNIVQVYEVGSHDNRPFFTLEYVDGGNLRERLRGGPLAPAEAAALVEQLARAAHAAHERGVVHRDLKPANVLLTRDGVPKIADFGLAKRLEGDPRLTRSGLILGTPAYMAPEQLGGRTPIGPGTDVYALGVILYETLTGRPPFESASPTDLVFQVGLREPIAPGYWRPQIPRPLEAVCLKCLNKAPHDRYASAEALADDLRRFLDGRPVRARQTSRLVRWCRRHPLRAALTAGAVLLAGLLLAVLILGAVGLQRQLAHAREEKQQARDAELRTRLDAEQTQAALLGDADQKRAALLGQVEQARAERNSAVQRRRQERAALDRLSGQLLDEAPTRLTEQREDQRRLLQRAASVYEELAAGYPADADDPLEAATAQLRAARLRQKLGEAPKAEVAYRSAADLLRKATAEPARALCASAHAQLALLLKDQKRLPEAETEFRLGCDLYARLAADFPKNAEYHVERATAHNNLGVLLNSLGRVPEAEAEHRRALAIRTQLAVVFAGRPQYRQQAALSHANLAIVLRSRDRLDEALTEYRKAQALQKRLTTEHSSVAEFRLERAHIHNSVGLLLSERRQWSEAETEHRQALALREQLAAEFPGVPAHAVDAAGSACNLGHLMADRGRPEDSLDWYHKAIQALRPIVDREPQYEKARRFLRNAHFGRARALDALNRSAKAVPDWEQAALLSPERERPTYRVAQADALARAGDHVKAFTIVNDASGDPGLPPELLYRLACTCGRATALVKEVPAKRDQYAARGVYLLARASTTGYFQDAAHLKLLLNEECLAPLRDRTDFNKLLADIKSRSGSGGGLSKP